LLGQSLIASLIGPVFILSMQTKSKINPSQCGRLLQPNNPLFTLARTGRLRLPSSWLEKHPVLINKVFYPFIVIGFAFLAPLIAAIIGVPLWSSGASLNNSQPDLSNVLYLIGVFLPLIFLVWLWLRIVEQRPLRTTGMVRPIFKPYLRGLGIGALLFVSAVLFLGLLGYLEIENSGRGGAIWTTLGGTVLVLFGWIIQGAAEEILARGFLMPILSIRWGPAVGIIFSSLLFSALHLLNPNLSIISILNLFLFGIFAAFYALWEGGLWGVFAIHATWNWAQGNIFGLSVSGINLQSSILLNLVETGPDWVTGGNFGPEGGVIVTLILVSGIGALVTLSRQNAEYISIN
jgi:membrane protease YdiL (CAAX protease family)